ncbi:MAG: nitronate monooxygenase, partial [Deltaproteobacteria bacterium]|nr:nitronate monooxygenase [Deltaproteobacteria bacterium]
MKSRICEMLGVDFPLVAFSHCRDVVAAVSRAGGFGVLGATAFSPNQLDLELKWIDDHIDGKPYGVDVLIPENLSIKHERDVTTHSLAERIPPQHREFVQELLIRHGVELTHAPHEENYRPGAGLSLQEEGALKLLEVAFQHPIKLIANALGVPPQSMLALGHRHGVPVAALVGA